VLCAVGLSAAIAVSVDIPLQRPDWRGFVRELGAAPPNGVARLIVVQRYTGGRQLEILMPGLSSVRRREIRVGELDLVAIKPIERGGWFCWWGSACNLRPSRISSRLQIPGMRRAGPALVYHQFVIQRFESRVPILLSLRSVTRALSARDRVRMYGLLEQRVA
jgi:hypothetical protein